ncbi:hypothetical protein HERIO_677 [Hepatospora eriocheir]|uniref:Uncharacterized protein n=1 Tax=Hepatospora eriocheir TaxID=1081669 RepID=A0A1X0QCM9_9MICR|nr:hypothetical protein HERIO_677 [Hepatospora eriocheir]
MDNLKDKVLKNPMLRDVSAKIGTTPENVISGVFVFFISLFYRFTFGKLLNNLLCVYLPVQEAVVLLRSQTTRVSDLNRVVIVFIIYAFVTVIEPFASTAIPFYGLVKIALMTVVYKNDSARSTIRTVVIDSIPDKICCSNSSIEKAQAAANKLNNQIKNNLKPSPATTNVKDNLKKVE